MGEALLLWLIFGCAAFVCFLSGECYINANRKQKAFIVFMCGPSALITICVLVFFKWGMKKLE